MISLYLKKKPVRVPFMIIFETFPKKAMLYGCGTLEVHKEPISDILNNGKFSLG